MKMLWKLILLLFSIISIVGTIITNQYSLFFTSFFDRYSYDEDQSKMFLKMLSSENHYFVQELEKDNDSIFTNTVELATNVNFKDVRSLIFDEIPGLFAMTSEIAVAGEGTDFTNLPIESSPPIEELLKEREVDEESLPNDDDKTEKPPVTQPEKKTVFIYHSHSRESFLPHLKDTEDPDAAQHKDVNITLVGERLGNKLLEHGIGTEVDKTDIATILGERNWKYWQSYQASREVVQAAMTANKDFVYFLDIHRDSGQRKTTTTTIDGKKYARLFFIYGESHSNYKENAKFAEELNKMIEDKYPSLTRGIFPKDKSEGNGVYNQDLSPNSLVIEIGGPENTLEEMYNTVDVLAEIFSEFYWEDAVEVNN